MKLLKYGLVFACVLLSSCATYTITTSSLKEQLREVEPEKRTYSILAGGLILFNEMQVNGLRSITVDNDKGIEEIINVGQRTQIRIHTKDDDYTTFYFDTMFILNDAILGQRTHFISSAIKPIPITDVTKIEIQ